ncbi:transducin family protein / WD-40 repeat family protein [Artemisia annua]|uniref:Transducin family protein / WD-40 repeat family protein n=1 Tax=Artemisia annua TaxID=35608 RepID=A0A2U1PXG0_ARTAN|nr:transducin family protein / WD-40 repeat family protein [Artemisia annua]
MKIRSMKLREAHKNNGVSSYCTVQWDLTAEHIVTSSSSDSVISIHDALVPSATPKFLRNHKDGVTNLALSPNSTCLASGSTDRSVKLYKFPGGEFESNISRFTLPIRALSFNRSGTMLAAGGDDDGIKLIITIDGSISRVLKGHRGSVTAIAFDPKSEYLASVDSVGTVMIWNLELGTTIHTLKNIAPNSSSDFSTLTALGWSPDGEMLAVSGLKNDIVMYDRDTAEKLFTLRGDHTKPVCFLAWSLNGKYLATSGLDRQVLIWDIATKHDIERQKFDEMISCMSWKPHGNALAVIDVMGKYGVWDSVVPSSMKSPTEGVPDSNSHKSNGLVFFEEEEKEPSISGSLSDDGEDSFLGSEPTSRKRLRKQIEYDDSDEGEDINDGMSLLSKSESRKKPSIGDKESMKKSKATPTSTLSFTGPKMQEAFQPGSTPAQPGKRRFLCYNMLGSITTMKHDEYSHIEIDFHDTGRGPRIPAMTDRFGFTMASLNENGSVFANLCNEKNMSTLMYRPFKSWANNSEWSMRFEEEEVRAVALGSSWVAAVTSLNFLRIFTEGGLQRHVVSLDGPVVTASGFGDELAVVTHSSPTLPSNEQQMLEFSVFNVPNGTETIRGRLPLTPGSCLTWFGFSEEGQLTSFDSMGFLRAFTKQYGGRWLPLFSASKLKKKEENYWMVGLNSSKLFSILCKSPDKFPQAFPKPVLTLLDLSIPIASSDLGAENLENEFIISNMRLSEIQRRIQEMDALGQDTTSLDDEAFNIETALDRCILRLIHSCCNGDKLVRAIELVKLLTHEKSVRGAIKLVTTLKLPNLAERFNTILEERLLKEATETMLKETTEKKDTLPKTNGDTIKTFTSPEISKAREPVNELKSPQLTSPSFVKKKATQEPAKVGKVLEPKETTKPDLKALVNKNVADLKEGEVKQVEVQRSSNPFAKSSKNQEKGSLLDSLKMLKKNESPSNK